MLNHIHLLTWNSPETSLSDIMRDFKRHTSKRIAELLEQDNEKLFLYVFKRAGEWRSKKVKYKIWQDEFHPLAIYSEKWFQEKLIYIHNNPVKKGFVTKSEDWKYSSARNWICGDDSVMKLDLDVLFDSGECPD